MSEQWYESSFSVHKLARAIHPYGVGGLARHAGFAETRNRYPSMRRKLTKSSGRLALCFFRLPKSLGKPALSFCMLPKSKIIGWVEA